MARVPLPLCDMRAAACVWHVCLCPCVAGMPLSVCVTCAAACVYYVCRCLCVSRVPTAAAAIDSWVVSGLILGKELTVKNKGPYTCRALYCLSGPAQHVGPCTACQALHSMSGPAQPAGPCTPCLALHCLPGPALPARPSTACRALHCLSIQCRDEFHQR